MAGSRPRALGVPLFERRPTGVIATPAGERVIALTRSALKNVDDVVATAQTMQDPLRGTVRLGVIPTIAPYLQPQVMPTVRERYPDLRPLLREERTSELTALVDSRELDVALVAIESGLGDLVAMPGGRRDPAVGRRPLPAGPDIGDMRCGGRV